MAETASSYGPEAIKVLRLPNDTLRQKLLETYREHLAIGPGPAWEAALEELRPHCPDVSEKGLHKTLLMSLSYFCGMWEYKTNGAPPNPMSGYPCMLSNWLYWHTRDAAQHFGIGVDDLVSRIVAVWMDHACNMDGIPYDQIPVPAERIEIADNWCI
ncbi:MAG: hypothetical protein ACPGOY_18690 [Rhodospirillaceae bacterium]